MTWVVYRVTVLRKPGGASAVCERGEWDALERAQPGHYTLVRAGLASEAEAERVARGGAGDAAGTASCWPWARRQR
jgi:hypothetical protein